MLLNQTEAFRQFHFSTSSVYTRAGSKYRYRPKIPTPTQL